MLLTIFINEKPIYLTDTLADNLIILSKQTSTIFLNNEKIDGKIFLNNMLKDGINAAIILGENFVSIKQAFFSQFEIIEAGGGIVQNENKELLFIFRRGKWDLPKGKWEIGETIEICASREVEEETGVKLLTLKRKIGETFHLYSERGNDILKISHWFYFTCSNTQKIVAQTEEDIAEVKWIAIKNIKDPMLNTFKNVQDIIGKFFEVVK